MKERINQLALQCGAWHQVYDEKRLMVNEYFDYQKLAKLVAQECIDIVENLAPGYSDYRNQIEDSFRRDTIEEIQYRFDISYGETTEISEEGEISEEHKVNLGKFPVSSSTSEKKFSNP